MTWLVGAALLASLGMALALARQVAERRREQSRLQALERDIREITGLIGCLNGSDWQRSVHGVLTALVDGGSGRAAALLGLSDSGTLEVRSFAAGSGEPPWDPVVADSAAYRALRAQASYAGERGTAYLPLFEEGEAIGVLGVRGGDATSAALQTAARLSELGLTGLRHLRKQAALSSTDGLTGLANHRHFQQALGVALGQAYLEGEPLALILLDIDRFKAVNDTHGHLLGDLVLREIALVLRRSLPPDAQSARYGGEEMAVLVSGAHADRADAIAEEIRRAVEAHEVLDFTSGVKLTVTVSLGVARYELGQGKSRLIARADEALYASKRSGRNRVTVAPSEHIT